jgi:hypothetical protein
MRNFRDYDHLIKGLAYQFSLTLKEDFDDLVQEGYIYFLLLEEEEDCYGLNCNFEAALCNCIKQNFLNRVKGMSYQKRAGEVISFHDVEYLLGHDCVKRLDDYLSLPNELREIVDSILNCPDELKTLVKTFGFRKGFKQYLTKIKRWNVSDVEGFFNEFARNIVF